MSRNNKDFFVVAVLGIAIVSSGCSGKVKGDERKRGLPALAFEKGGLPGVRHAAHPEDSGDRVEPGARPAPIACDQAALEKEASRKLKAWLHVPGLDNPTPLPPERAPYVDPRAVNRFALALGRKSPKAGRRIHSLRALGHIRIYFAPDHDSEAVGKLQKGSRIPVYGFVGRVGCRAGWMALSPYAYVCSTRLRPDRHAPRMVPQPRVPKGRITPGVYGYIRRGGAPAYSSRGDAKKKVISRRLPGGFFIRFGRFTRIKDRNFWKTTKGLYVPVDRIARHVPSRFHGFELDGKDLRLPMAIVRFKGPQKKGVAVYHSPGKRRVMGRLKRYTAVRVLGTVVRKGRYGHRRRYLRVGPCQWIQARGARVAHLEPPPPGVAATERWIDVDLHQQILVAYEGTRPVYVTLVSTGKKKHETRHGVFRVYWKVSEVDMANEADAAEEYLASAVPWSMFFWKGQALHGAYWHDDFGRVKSHGCVNLSPKDARFLFDWTRPTLPPGWRHAWHGDRFPGPVVRIRRRKGERPRLLGLARKFAPKEVVIARDEAYKRRIHQETLDMLRGNSGDDDDEENEGDDEGSKTPSMAPPLPMSRSAAAPAPRRATPRPRTHAPRRRATLRRQRRAHRAHRGGLQPTLRPLAAPPPPPRRGP